MLKTGGKTAISGEAIPTDNNEYGVWLSPDRRQVVARGSARRAVRLTEPDWIRNHLASS